MGTAAPGDVVFGGGKGIATRVLGIIDLIIGDDESDDFATIFGNVYGGSEQGRTNGNSSQAARRCSAMSMAVGIWVPLVATSRSSSMAMPTSPRPLCVFRSPFSALRFPLPAAKHQ